MGKCTYLRSAQDQLTATNKGVRTRMSLLLCVCVAVAVALLSARRLRTISTTCVEEHLRISSAISRIWSGIQLSIMHLDYFTRVITF